MDRVSKVVIDWLYIGLERIVKKLLFSLGNSVSFVLDLVQHKSAIQSMNHPLAQDKIL